jgi:pyruvate, orthophosphate dikinase
MMQRAAILIALRIKGFARPDIVAECLGLSADAVSNALETFEREGLAETKKLGVKLTPDGQAEADRLSAQERAGCQPGYLEQMYARFCELNAPFKALMADWQMREVDGTRRPNDHTDEAYDKMIIDRLENIDEGACALCQSLGETVSRFARYDARLKAAKAKIENGEHRFLAAPIIESYHTVWFELHEDLIRLTGRSRAEEAAAGRAV